ncbi:hypothetical protein SARC_03276 [Sphaeroforma arctica JP610]|uniref:Uncharacterized protein n=1 Tax=Sphaeroforma arctica JP610 TaxID=667725 RepID=A0A0L0G662_9EUKA|nr:hypothetical protein SARC_03276 [Sphaeroforma arctica JP610]KNC84502.1 hypothetical protein SARC_03276 [Sphaeroforma arctica JP610]|eukprot:XP_014158404.1 hypothetical protein SARC_03276 [Sphaeroforma arctica JP610]
MGNAYVSVSLFHSAINKENEAERERVRVAEQEKAEVQVAAAVPPIAAVEEEQFRKHQHALKVMMRQVAITQAYHNGLISS